MKPWREIAVPHPDVLEGTFQQAEFAADLTAVRTGRATREYGDAVAFFQRTFITEGMRALLTQVAQRLNGQGGEPVIQLQTAFGGGKTHTMLAVYHLATRKVPLADLAGMSTLVEQAGLIDMPQARVVVIDGNALSPGQPWQYGRHRVHTLWGELAWQLGGEDAYALLKESDVNGTSPGKDVLQELLARYAPCVILIDELVAYVRQFEDNRVFSGGSYNSNMSFVQALTEACKLVPNALLLASLPESEVEAGRGLGITALRAFEKVFGRVQALWRPVATEEAFEIVRRRLFEPVRDEAARAAVCRAFAETYIAEGARLPSETQETRYRERLLQAYPIHPEIFDRLYEDWTTIEGFQRTRGVLKLMAKVIYRLWKDDNKDLMIMPGSLPLYDGNTRNELTYYLNAGWDPVVEKDIDGERAETTELETREPRFGAVNAARRVARTIFLGSAPASTAAKPGLRGLNRARVLLGCLQPNQSAAAFTDALSRLADRLHYLNSSGDKGSDTTLFWFDTRANLRREMEERKKRFDDARDVRGRIEKLLKKATDTAVYFEGKHVFTAHRDVPDDQALRLVVLAPQFVYAREETRPAFDAVIDYVRSHGEKPRYRGNRLIFLAPDHAALARLRDLVRAALAWGSIVDDVKGGRLNSDRLQERQAEQELQGAESVLPQAARECYKWLLCPVQHGASDPTPTVEPFPLNTSGSSLGSELERVCVDNELVISTWSPIHLRTHLQQLYWKADRPVVSATTFWEDTLRYLYLPRLKNRQVFEQAIIKGATSRDFFGTAYGQTRNGFEGFQLGDPNIQVDTTLLLIEPQTAQNYEAAQRAAHEAERDAREDARATQEAGQSPDNPIEPPDTPLPPIASPGGSDMRTGGKVDKSQPSIKSAESQVHTFIGTVDINAATAKMRLLQIAEEIIAHLAGDPQATVQITVEINAHFPDGPTEHIKRIVTENAVSLGFKNKTWE